MVVLFAIIVAALSRILPHPDNFTATEALAIFGAAHLSRKYLAFLMPIILMFATDFIINNTIARPFFTDHEGVVVFSNYMVYNWLALIAIVGLSTFTLRKLNFSNLMVTALIGSIIFFLVSNFGVWMSSAIYPKTFSGLMTCFVAAIPFFKSSLVGTLFFTLFIFGVYELIKRYILSSLILAKE